MSVETRIIEIDAAGNTDIIDITEEVRQGAQEVGLHNGIVNVFIGGATAGITTASETTSARTRNVAFIAPDLLH